MPNKVSSIIMDKAYKMVSDKGYSAKQTSSILKIDDGTMRKRLRLEYGYNFLPDGKKSVDSNYFNSIDTEEKAYWLGFFTADGYVNDKNGIELCLAEIDGYHVESFKKAIKSNHTISTKKAILNDKIFLSKRISIKDRQMANALRSYGITNKKSYESYIPKNLFSDNLMRHYIRGLFDGDGCIVIISTNPSIRCACALTTASFQMAEDYITILNKHIRIVPKINHTMSRLGVLDLSICNKKETLAFLNWIYKDATIYLKRKYNKYIAVLSQKLPEDLE